MNQPTTSSTPIVDAGVAALKRTALSGSMASALSMLVLALRGRSETGSSVAAINAPSHWLHGEESLNVDHATMRHTLAGALIHHASSMLWGLAYERLVSGRKKPLGIGGLALGAVGVTAAAAVIDLKLVPKRLTPGFERRLSPEGVVMTYGAFAAGLLLSGLVMREKQLARDKDATPSLPAS